MEVLMLTIGLLAAPEIREEVEVRRVQFEVTAWPDGGELALCREIDLDQVEVLVDGAWKTRLQDPGIVIDRIGVRPGSEGGPANESPSPAPQRLVLYFDEVHFFDAERLEEDSARSRAFEQARAMLESEFDPSSGDRVMLASFMGNDTVHIETGWLANRDAAIAALDRLDEQGKDRSKVSATRNVMDRWSDALEDLALALGGLDESENWTRKILVFATDLPVDADWAEELASASEALSAARATVHTIDTRRPLASQAYGLGSLAWNAGGHFWTNGAEVTSAVQTMRALPGAGCVLLVTANVGRIEGVVRVDFKDERFRSESLMALGRPASELEQDQREARRLRPSWGEGIEIDTLIIPGERVRGGRLARLYVRASSTHPDNTLRVGFESADFDDVDRRMGGQRDFVFELVVRPRKQTTYRVVVESADGAHGASDRHVFRASSTPSWHLIDEEGVPLLASPLYEGRPIRLRGYGCPRDDAQSIVLVPEQGEPVELTLDSESSERCGWHRAVLVEGLPAGSWKLGPSRRFQGGPLLVEVLPVGGSPSAGPPTGPRPRSRDGARSPRDPAARSRAHPPS